MELNEMEKKLLFQVEGDYQTKILNELYMTVRYLQRRADLHGVDVPIVDQLVSQLAADAQHLPKLFNGHDVRVFRKHHLVKLSELSFLHRLEPPLSVLNPHFCGDFYLLPLIRIVPAPESHHGVSLLWCARSFFGKSWRHLPEAYPLEAAI